MNETQQRIDNIRQQIDELRKEEVTLPGDVALGFMTRRPELLTIGQTDPDRKAILDALAGEMRMNANLNLLVSVLSDHIKGMYRVLDRCGMALQSLERINIDE